MTRPAFDPRPTVLQGVHATLQPLTLAHLDDLLLAGGDEDIWRWMPQAYFLDRPLALEWIEAALAEAAEGQAVPFAMIDNASGRAVGSTRLFDFRREHRALEIGWTWIGTAHQRTAINTECKRLLLGYAFEQMGALRVQLKTDSRNVRSRTAIQRIGGQYEGTLRNHVLLPSGDHRHSAFFGITADEWPDVRQRLDELLAAKQ
ncbi:MAG: RimJ/RimL family protein N-acetyltransferase [Pseudohongiellaceae bacterium]|jgi:RimJ/RimL family protein N-acetyltransferase